MIVSVAAGPRCETLQVIFGDGFRVPEAVAPADWIEGGCRAD